jgi:hypothetical protein
LNGFLARKRKKNCASRFEAKKTAMGDEGLSVASRLVARGCPFIEKKIIDKIDKF